MSASRSAWSMSRQITTWHASVFVAFLFGFVLLHTAFAQLAYTQLWPWVVAKNNVHLPWEMLHSMDFPMILGQLVLPLLAGLLASWLYAKRQHSALNTNFQIFIRPALLGMAAYLLTSLILLALIWIAAYADPNLLRSIERDLPTGLPAAIGLNIGAVIILCFASIGMRNLPRRTLGLTAVLLALLAILGYLGVMGLWPQGSKLY